MTVTGMQERDSCDPSRAAEVELEMDELDRSKRDWAVEEVTMWMRGEDCERQSVDDTSRPFSTTSFLDEVSENDSGGGVKMRDVIANLFTSTMPEIWCTREYSRVVAEFICDAVGEREKDTDENVKSPMDVWMSDW